MNTTTKLPISCKVFLAQSALIFEDIYLDLEDTLYFISKENINNFTDSKDDAIILHNVIKTLDYIDKIDYSNLQINLNLYIKLNSIPAENQALFAGKLRDIPIAIGCIKEEIGVSKKEEIISEIDKLNTLNTDNSKKIIPEVFCRLSKMQPFFDGNKRSTLFCATLP